MAQSHEVEERVWSDAYQTFSNIISSDTTLGDIFYLSAAGQPIIVLNTQKAAADLLDRRAAIYSDRPRNIVAAEILCGGLALGLQRYGALWVHLCSFVLVLAS
jgi:hypothetical protein